MTNWTMYKTQTCTYLSDSCPVLQNIQIRQHIDDIWSWAKLRMVLVEGWRQSSRKVRRDLDTAATIKVKKQRMINNWRISETTEGLLLFLSGLKASLLFFLPDTSSVHNSDRRTRKTISFTLLNITCLLKHDAMPPHTWCDIDAVSVFLQPSYFLLQFILYRVEEQQLLTLHKHTKAQTWY